MTSILPGGQDKTGDGEDVQDREGTACLSYLQ